MRSKAEMGQLNLRNGTKKLKSRKGKKTDMLRSNVNNLRSLWIPEEEKKESLWWERFAEKEGFKLRVKE